MRWPLMVGQRVYVQCAHKIGVVNRISHRKIDVEVYFPDEPFHQGPRVYLWDEGLVPVDDVITRILGGR